MSAWLWERRGRRNKSRKDGMVTWKQRCVRSADLCFQRLVNAGDMFGLQLSISAIFLNPSTSMPSIRCGFKPWDIFLKQNSWFKLTSLNPYSLFFLQLTRSSGTTSPAFLFTLTRRLQEASPRHEEEQKHQIEWLMKNTRLTTDSQPPQPRHQQELIKRSYWQSTSKERTNIFFTWKNTKGRV